MKVFVIGTGTMAKGIVKAFAAKMPVVMKSRTQASLDKAMASVEKGYAKLVEKGKMTQEAMNAILANITTTTDYATFADADLVIEAASEDMQLKKEVFATLDSICKPETIFATNSSSLSITEIAACTSRPTQFIGMPFLPIKKINAAFNVYNPLAFTASHWDPEATLSGALSQGGVSTGGINYATFSAPRQYILTLTFDF